MADLISMLAAASGIGAEEADPNFKQTVLLLHGDGTNGAQNNTFLDSSSNNFTITRNGNTTQGTFSPFSLAAGEWSNFITTGDDYLSTASNTWTQLGSGDFSLEAFVYIVAIPVSFAIIDSRSSSFVEAWVFGVNNSNKLRFIPNSSVSFTSTSNVPLNEWVHLAVCRVSGVIKGYINGVEDASSLSIGSAINGLGSTPRIGDLVDSSTTSSGYISNLRVIIGSSPYNGTFTPPTAPLTAITNTSLLTCQSNRFVDNSSNAFAITRNGDVRVTPFSPFAPTAAYSPSVNGGSGYFDGTGDKLTVAANSAFQFGTGDFAVEFWFYPTSLSSYQTPIDMGYNSSGSYAVQTGNGNGIPVFYSAGSALLTSSSAWNVNAFNHVVVCRSGTTLSMFINGSRTATATNSTNLNSNSTLGIGAAATASPDYPVVGYMSNVRLVKGSSVYDPTQTTLTVPTAPLTAITNTSLLCNFTNAGIFDQTGKNALETVGNAQIDTTTKKFGTGSMEFDGTGDYLLLPHNPDQQLGTGNFTIEFWVYLASGDTGSARGLVAKGGASTGWLVSLDSSQKVVFTYTTSTITSSGAITTNAWNYIAVVREGTGSNQTKIYIGGTNDGTGTVSTDFNQTTSMYIGANRTGGDAMKGFIDDLRITKGVARYTANFTPPTAAFPNE